MPNSRRSKIRAIFTSAVLATLAVAPALSNAQTLTLVQSAARSAGNNNPGFNTDFATAATSVDLTPAYIVFDTTGNQYVSDTVNNCVRKIDTTGTISTIAGLAVTGGDTCDTSSNATPTATQGLYQPTALALDSLNNLYIADSKHNCVRKLANGSSGVAALTTVAGTCGSATSATLSPNGLAIDSANNLYIAIQDTEVLPTVSTYQVLQSSTAGLCVMAGDTSTLGLCSGVTGNVVLNAPSGLALDAAGDLFIADTGNNCVREVAGLTTQQTAVGQCSNDSTGDPAMAISSPRGLGFSPTQFLFITESSSTSNNVVSYVLGSSTVTRVAGLADGAAGAYMPTQDGKSAINTPLNAPLGIASDGSGNLFVADSGNWIIRELSNSIIFPSTPVEGASATSPVTFTVNTNVNLSASVGPDFAITSNTCVGAITASVSATPTTCQVVLQFSPSKPGVRDASLRLTDSVSGTVVAIGLEAAATGPLSVFNPGTVATAAASLATPIAVTVDSAGNAYILQSGTTAGTASLVRLPVGGALQTVIAQGQGLLTPTAVALDAAGNYFIADATHGTVSRFGADGSINTSYLTGLDTPAAIYADNFDNLYIAQGGAASNVIEVYLSGVRRIVAGGGSTAAANGVLASQASFVSPSALYLDLKGILYIADSGGHLVYAVDNSGIIHRIAGNGTTSTSIIGQATGTALLSPTSIFGDAASDIYIADSTANIVYTVFSGTTSAGNNISMTLGTGAAGNTGDGGFANLAQVNAPLSVAVDSGANLFVVDSGNSSVREVTHPDPTLNFGTVTVGQTSPVIVQQLSNFGNDNLTLNKPFATSDSHFAVDSDTTTCGTTIITGSTCNLGYTFTPTSHGPLTANSTLASNSPNSPQPIQLIGNGTVNGPLQFTLHAQTEVYGQPFPETVSILDGDPAPTGMITFTLGTQVLCSLSGAFGPSTTCAAANSGLSVGSYPVTFTYSGDTIYPTTSQPTTLTVTPAPLTVTVNNVTRLVGAPNPTFSGTLTGVVPGDTVQVAYTTTATAASPAGRYPIVATITASAATLANYAITSNPGTLTITSTGTGAAATATTVATSGSPAPVGTSVTFTARVTATTGVPSGTVIFSDGSTVLGQQTLSASGIATFSTAALISGTHTITAAFQANTDFTASSSAVTQVMTGSATTGSFTISASPATQSIRGAGSTVYQITLNSAGDFAGQIALTCSGLPADASCSFGSNPTLTAGGAATTTMTVTNTAADAALRTSFRFKSDLAPLTAAAVFPIELTGFGVFFAGLRRRKTPAGNALGTQKMPLFAAILVSLGILTLAGCCFNNTTFKTYTINITGSSVSSTAPAQSTSVILSVGN
jgi:hypothetical protein